MNHSTSSTLLKQADIGPWSSIYAGLSPSRGGFAAESYIVAGRKYSLMDDATIFVPEGFPRQLINEGSEKVELIWVYAGEKPERTSIDSRFCAEN
jgi:hypothetical protein